MTNKLLVEIDHNTLMKLLGGNTEAEIKLKNGIVQNFASKQLKSLLNDDKIQEILSETKYKLIKGAEKAGAKFIGKWTDDYPREFNLAPEVKRKIEKVIYFKVKKIVSDKYNDIIKKIDSDFKDIKDNYNKQMKKAIDKKIDETFEKMVQEEIDSRIKKIAESLGKKE